MNHLNVCRTSVSFPTVQINNNSVFNSLRLIFFLPTCSSSSVETSFGDLETSFPCHPGIPSLEDFFLPCKGTSFALHSCSYSSFSQETFSWQLWASTLAPLISPEINTMRRMSNKDYKI